MDANTELAVLGFVRAGAISPVASGKRCVAELASNVTGFVLYAYAVGGQIKKFGTTRPSLRARVGQNVSTINAVIALIEGRPVRDALWHHRPFDAFKRLAPQVILANRRIEVWAQVLPSYEAMMAREFELNNTYRPEWTKEARSRAAIARTPCPVGRVPSEET